MPPDSISLSKKLDFHKILIRVKIKTMYKVNFVVLLFVVGCSHLPTRQSNRIPAQAVSGSTGPIWSDDQFCSAGLPSENEMQKLILDRYNEIPEIATLLKSEGTTKSTMTSFLKSESSYRALVEIGVQETPGGEKLLMGYFPQYLKILELAIDGRKAQLFDLTDTALPSEGLWAHFKVTTGNDIALAKDPDKLVKRSTYGVDWFYLVSSRETSDVFIPISTPDLARGFRALVLQPKSPGIFWLHPNGSISLNGMTTEESDGNLAFGIRGGGKTGWSPWNGKFMGIVTNVAQGKLSKLKNAQDLILPAPSTNSSGGLCSSLFR